MRFSKFVFNQKQTDIVHSSGLARDNLMGAASTQPFSQRKHLETRRQAIRSYRDATIHADLHQHKREVGCVSRNTNSAQPMGRTASTTPQAARQQLNATGSVVSPSQTPAPYSFREPPSRYGS